MKYPFLLLLASLGLHAAVFEVKYSVSYWILGRIGTTHLRLETNNRHYRIHATAELEGVAALIARHHREHHTSEGVISSNGTLIPVQYDVNKTLDDYEDLKHYYFNRRQKRILLKEHIKHEKIARRFDLNTMHFVTEKYTKKNRSTRLLSFYCENDLLTLYFNSEHPLKNLEGGDSIFFKAVGARHGDVHVTRLKKKNRFAVKLDQDIFKSKDGILFIESDDEMYVKNALFKDVLLFGDLEIKREYLKRSP
ncbi:MAG TPA: DUF3108 domain-containing protein [Sulfuricurvum sp.]|nr:DUF3108 domain-containing protein [Sulfuricurvum sp.]